MGFQQTLSSTSQAITSSARNSAQPSQEPSLPEILRLPHSDFAARRAAEFAFSLGSSANTLSQFGAKDDLGNWKVPEHTAAEIKEKIKSVLGVPAQCSLSFFYANQKGNEGNILQTTMLPEKRSTLTIGGSIHVPGGSSSLAFSFDVLSGTFSIGDRLIKSKRETAALIAAAKDISA